MCLVEGDDYDDSYQTETTFIYNLMRLKLGRSKVEMQTAAYVFIDTFWDPLWMMNPKYYDRYFQIMCEFLPAPDISIFLKVDEDIALRRAIGRDPETEHTLVGEQLVERRNAFLAWAFDNIPNFHRIHADVPSNEVLKKADAIIAEYESSEPKPELDAVESTPVEPEPKEKPKPRHGSRDPWG